MNYNEMFKSVEEAESIMKHADRLADRMARFIVNRLRFVNSNTLKMIKKELSNFNAQTGEWKS